MVNQKGFRFNSFLYYYWGGRESIFFLYIGSGRLQLYDIHVLLGNHALHLLGIPMLHTLLSTPVIRSTIGSIVLQTLRSTTIARIMLASIVLGTVQYLRYTRADIMESTFTWHSIGKEARTRFEVS